MTRSSSLADVVGLCLSRYPAQITWWDRRKGTKY